MTNQTDIITTTTNPRARVYIEKMCQFYPSFKRQYLGKTDQEKREYLLNLERLLAEINLISLEEIILNTIKWQKKSDGVPTVQQIVSQARNRRSVGAPEQKIDAALKEKWGMELADAIEAYNCTKDPAAKKMAYDNYVRIRTRQGNEEWKIINGRG